MSGRKAVSWTAAGFCALAVLAGGVKAQGVAHLGDTMMVCAMAQRPAGGWVATNMVTYPPCGGGGGFATRNNAFQLTYVGNAPSGYQVAVCAFDTTQAGAFLAGNAEWVLVAVFRSAASCGGGANNVATIQRR